MSDERRAVDYAQEASGISSEAAALAEYIRETNPHHTKYKQIGLLIELIDDAHESATKATIELEDGD